MTKMFCRLCVNSDLEDYQNLYNNEGQKNEVYQIAAKYFEKELDDMDVTAAANEQKCSRIICTSCWRRISEFHSFKQMVQEAQQQYERLLKFEQLHSPEVKLEVAADSVQIFDEMFNVDTEEVPAPKIDPGADPFDVTDQGEILDEQQESPIDELNLDFGADESSDDDKPLLSRVGPKTKKILRNTRKIPVSRENMNKLDKETASKVAKDRKQIQRTLEYDEFIAAQWKPALNCGQCDQVCGNFRDVTTHFREVHNSKRPFVVCCRNKYHHRCHLVEHLKMHLDPELFKCPQCGKCSTNRRNLQSHVKSVHPTKKLERTHECEVCHKRFAKISILRGHMDIHAAGDKDHVCPHCNKGFVLVHRLNIHIRNVHSTIYSSVCELCGKSFRGPYALKTHLREQHEGVEKRKWSCDQCDAKLNSKYSLKRHKRVAHHDGSTVYVCSECGKVSLSADALRSHKKYVHQKERKYKCSICDKAFKVAVVLKEHMTTHTGQDLYQCPHCPKTFKVNANMHHHRKRVHPKEWAEKRQHRNLATRSDLSKIANEIVM